MRFSLFYVLAATSLVTAAPAPAKRDGIDLLDDLLLFDAPAYQTKSGWAVDVRAFAYVRQAIPVTAALAGTMAAVLEGLGIKVGDRLGTLEERLRLFTALGLGSQDVAVTVSGCSSGKAVVVGKTDAGGMLNAATAGCAGAKEVSVSASTPLLGNRVFKANVFPSPSNGWGVLSDIDDTIKVSDVLDLDKQLESAFLKEAEPVAGMPKLYQSLRSDLGESTQFVYLTGSPFQMQPMLRSFVKDAGFPTGPMLLRNLTLTDLNTIIGLVQSGGTQEYKVAQINKLHSQYPSKRWVAIGDSTQKDPEAYADAFRSFGKDWISCIWIRKVEGANNEDSRFAAAFKDVDTTRWRLFTDSAELEGIDVAAGKC